MSVPNTLWWQAEGKETHKPAREEEEEAGQAKVLSKKKRWPKS